MPGEPHVRLLNRLNHNHHHPHIPHTTHKHKTHNRQHTNTQHIFREDLCAETKRVTMAFVARDAGTSAARRRRERRLRSMLRHERMTRRNGPCRDDPPLSSTETDDGKGRKERRVEQRHGPDDSSSLGGKDGVFQFVRRWGCACRPADTSC